MKMPSNADGARGRSREGAWIEMMNHREKKVKTAGRSREGAWIEMLQLSQYRLPPQCRSREGAWIEILRMCENIGTVSVAPARERGLKLPEAGQRKDTKRRSREGAWIEICIL